MTVLLLIGLGAIILFSVYGGSTEETTIGIDSGFVPEPDISPGFTPEPDQPAAVTEIPEQVQPAVHKLPVSVSRKVQPKFLSTE
jgi:hypothetical protein